MEALFFFALVGAISLTWLKYRHQLKMKELDQRMGPPPQALQAAQHQVHALQAARGELEERIRNLESIVCSVDFELSAKLDRLASRQLALTQMTRASAETAETAALSLGSIQPGSRVAGRFVVESQLGVGGMGAVFLARDEQLGEMVALKVIAGSALLDPAAADRFRREASAARRISHPNVVRLHDLGEEQGMLFLSMEYIAGTSLTALIERHGALSVEQVREIGIQLCHGLDAAHEAGVVHRDLKPGNVLIDAERRVKIIDFGLARLPHVEGMTATGMILGTPEYMAPEQVRGRPVDPRTDVYAAGAVLYHALVGRPPFSGETPIAVSFKQCTETPVPPHQIRPQLSPAWSAVVLRAMAKNPSERFDSARDLAAALPPA